MILFQLKCPADHRFEAWFRDGATYEAQVADGAIACPLCGDVHVTKAPMAPRIAKSRPGGEPDDTRKRQGDARKLLAELQRAVEQNCDYVGDRFAEEARRIHYGEADPRGIYGEASTSDVEALKEEGVTIHRIPWLPRNNS